MVDYVFFSWWVDNIDILEVELKKLISLLHIYFQWEECPEFWDESDALIEEIFSKTESILEDYFPDTVADVENLIG